VAEFHLFNEIKRRSVPRATVLYAGSAWALAQRIARMGPSARLPEWTTRRFLVAARIGLPVWIAFAWYFEFAPEGSSARAKSIRPMHTLRAAAARSPSGSSASWLRRSAEALLGPGLARGSA